MSRVGGAELGRGMSGVMTTSLCCGIAGCCEGTPTRPCDGTKGAVWPKVFGGRLRGLKMLELVMMWSFS